MNGKVIARRIRAIRRRMNKKKIRFLLVTSSANVTYITGFLGEDSWAAIAKGRVYLLTDSRYTEQAQKECPSCKIIDRAGPMANAVANLVKRLKSVRTIAVEDSVSMADFEQLKKSIKARLKTTSGIVEAARSIKDQSEIAAIKSAAAISTKALEQLLPHIKPGVSESELAGMLDFQIRKLGARNSFETIVAFGPNGSRPHHQPGKRKLKKKDAVLIDFGARYKGYCSDITRCLVIGGMTAFYKKVYDVVEQAQAAAIKTIRPGVKLTQVDAAAREVIDKAGLPVYGHGTGHGFGLQIHEDPFLKPDGKGKLKAGQVITIEPGIYIRRQLGIRIEDDVLVTETGHKILTRSCPHSLVLPDSKV
ncbi:MAG: aminopeptidase P family protein [Sedimentisphaerales bacterium]|nr:aminopeptidase P family protein [Sedimentisphaerales bacterium]